MRPWLAVVAMLAAVVPLSGATAAAGCRVTTYTATELPDGYYLYGVRELWQESNGHPGLQRTVSFCTGGASLAADTCIAHSETFAALNCAVIFGENSAALP